MTGPDPSPQDDGPFDAPAHATCVSYQNRGVLICGGSGSGKSGLALQLIAMGAVLVADDRVTLALTKTCVRASPPATIKGMIEARGVGILNIPSLDGTDLHLVVDMDVLETDRLPPPRTRSIGAHVLPLIHKSVSAHFPAAVLLCLAYGRKE